MNYGAAANYQTYSDIYPTPSSMVWADTAPSSFIITGVRRYNTDVLKGPGPTGDGTYSWVSPLIYHPLFSGAASDGNTPGMGTNYAQYPQAGNYIDLRLRTNQVTGLSGCQDNGQYIGNIPIEFVTQQPHQLRTFDSVQFNNVLNVPFPYVLPISWDLNLPGTATANNGSAIVTTSTSQTSQIGQRWSFSGDTSSGNYLVTAGSTTSWTISPPFSGASSSSLVIRAQPNIVTLSGTAIVTNGSPSIIFSSPQTLTNDQGIIVDSTGYAYKVSPAITNSTIGNLFPVYQGPTTSGVSVQTVPACQWFDQAGVVVVTSPTSFVIDNENAFNILNPFTNTVSGINQLTVSRSGIFAGVLASGTHNSTSIITNVPLTNQIQQSWNFLGDTTSGTYTVTACTLSALGTVAQNSSTVTLNSSVSGQLGQAWTFVGDSSAKTYTVISGVGNSYTISPVYGGTGGANSGIIKTTGGDVNWTISPAFAGIGSPTGMVVTQFTTLTAGLNFIGNTMTYGFAANLCAQFPGCACWIPVGPHCSVALAKAIAAEMAPFLLPNSEVIVEMGLENWNFPSFPTGFATSWWGRLMAYMPSGTQINPYYQSQGQVIDRYQSYAAMVAPIHDAFQQEFDTFDKNIKVVRFLGSFVDGAVGVTQNMLQFASSGAGVSPQIPVGAVAPALYIIPPADSTWAAAANGILPGTASVTSGSPNVITSMNQASKEIGQTWQFIGDTTYGSYTVVSGSTTSWQISPSFGGTSLIAASVASTSQPNWSCAHMHDFVRHYLKYSSANRSLGTSQLSAIQSYSGPSVDSQGRSYAGQVNGKPGLFAYEAELQTPDPNARPHLGIDLSYHPEQENSFNTMCQTWQDTGFDLANIYSLGGIRGGNFFQQTWQMILFQQQQLGPGLTNLYITPQGGYPGDFRAHDAQNQAVQLYTFQNLMALLNNQIGTETTTGGRRYLRTPFNLHKGRRF